MSGDKFTPPPPAPPPPSDDAIIVSSPMLSELAEAQAQADEKASWKEAEEQEALQMMKEPIGSPDLESLLSSPPPRSPASPSLHRAFVVDFDHAVEDTEQTKAKQHIDGAGVGAGGADAMDESVGNVRIRLLPSLDDSDGEDEIGGGSDSGD